MSDGKSWFSKTVGDKPLNLSLSKTAIFGHWESPQITTSGYYAGHTYMAPKSPCDFSPCDFWTSKWLQMTENEWNSADWSRKHQGTWKFHLIDETFSNLGKLKVFLKSLKRKNLQTSFSRNITFRSPGKDWRWPKNPNNTKFGGILLLWTVHKMSGRVFRLTFMVAHTGGLNSQFLTKF